MIGILRSTIIGALIGTVIAILLGLVIGLLLQYSWLTYWLFIVAWLGLIPGAVIGTVVGAAKQPRITTIDLSRIPSKQ